MDMKIGDLVRWSDSGRAYLLDNIGLVIKLEVVSSNPGALILWLDSEYGPQKAWTPKTCIEVISENKI